jgi:hypothetical protein
MVCRYLTEDKECDIAVRNESPCSYSCDLKCCNYCKVKAHFGCEDCCLYNPIDGERKAEAQAEREMARYLKWYEEGLR